VASDVYEAPTAVESVLLTSLPAAVHFKRERADAAASVAKPAAAPVSAKPPLKPAAEAKSEPAKFDAPKPKPVKPAAAPASLLPAKRSASPVLASPASKSAAAPKPLAAAEAKKPKLDVKPSAAAAKAAPSSSSSSTTTAAAAAPAVSKSKSSIEFNIAQLEHNPTKISARPVAVAKPKPVVAVSSSFSSTTARAAPPRSDEAAVSKRPAAPPAKPEPSPWLVESETSESGDEKLWDAQPHYEPPPPSQPQPSQQQLGMPPALPPPPPPVDVPSASGVYWRWYWVKANPEGNPPIPREYFLLYYGSSAQPSDQDQQDPAQSSVGSVSDIVAPPEGVSVYDFDSPHELYCRLLPRAPPELPPALPPPPPPPSPQQQQPPPPPAPYPYYAGAYGPAPYAQPPSAYAQFEPYASYQSPPSAPVEPYSPYAGSPPLQQQQQQPDAGAERVSRGEIFAVGGADGKVTIRSPEGLVQAPVAECRGFVPARGVPVLFDVRKGNAGSTVAFNVVRADAAPRQPAPYSAPSIGREAGKVVSVDARRGTGVVAAASDGKWYSVRLADCTPGYAMAVGDAVRFDAVSGIGGGRQAANVSRMP